ncbi:hypothetical protein LZ30DRAFT_385002 [Colletotrichum cereale]|nr:hypothetical protein LZ30DRAFT_385002 [Colletotrichum cereale]
MHSMRAVPFACLHRLVVRGPLLFFSFAQEPDCFPARWQSQSSQTSMIIANLSAPPVTGRDAQRFPARSARAAALPAARCHPCRGRRHFIRSDAIVAFSSSWFPFCQRTTY